MLGCQAVGLLVPELLVPQLPGYWVVVAEAGHNCGWLNVWLVELWRQAQLRVRCNYSVRNSHMAGRSHSNRSHHIANWIYDSKSSICGYSASAFGNSVSMLIAILVAIGPL